jgi:hypothetical protein
VVDVRAPATWDPAVVQHHDVVGAQMSGELAGDADLCVSAVLPRAGAVRLCGQSREGQAERAEVCAGALLALCASALIRADRACAGRPSGRSACVLAISGSPD